MSQPKKQRVGAEGGQNEVADVDTETIGYEEQLSQIRKVQEAIQRSKFQCEEEVAAIERKYYLQQRPYYEKRSQILQQIPDFYRTVFLNCAELRDMLADEDYEIMKYIVSVDVSEEHSGGRLGTRVELELAENPYIGNKVLVKSLEYPEDSDSLVVVPTHVMWKDGRAPNGTTDAEDGSRKRKRSVGDSFFDWFASTVVHDEDDYLNGDDVLRVIVNIWADPVKYYYQTEENFVVDENAEEAAQEDEDYYEDQADATFELEEPAEGVLAEGEEALVDEQGEGGLDDENGEYGDETAYVVEGDEPYEAAEEESAIVEEEGAPEEFYEDDAVRGEMYEEPVEGEEMAQDEQVEGEDMIQDVAVEASADVDLDVDQADPESIPDYDA